jgi:hypothetical protein
MNDVLTFAAEDLVPDSQSILSAQGVIPGGTLREDIVAGAESARKLFLELAEPKAIMREISAKDFDLVYRGNGRNAQPALLDYILPRTGHLALVAATVGRTVSQRIAEMFGTGDFMLGAMLDAAASGGADRASQMLERLFQDRLVAAGQIGAMDEAYCYSPGYCGWHISAQRQLFDYLHPEVIGLTLRDSFLMDPLKSISGVLIAGPAEIHRFDNTFPFCAQCRTRSCRARMGRSQKG